MSVLQKLTEGVQHRDMQAEGQALLNKWEATGLLEGLSGAQSKQGMAVLLENQAKELLREASAMAAGDVEGFAAVAFPIVRRVFGGLIANDLVSVQPMSLPSGLIFFLDFVKSPDSRGDGSSIYGGNVVAKGIQEGVSLDANGEDGSRGAGGFYNNQTGFSHATSSVQSALDDVTVAGFDGGQVDVTAIKANEDLLKAIRHDPDILGGDQAAHVMQLDVTLGDLAGLNRDALSAIRLKTVGDLTAAELATLNGGGGEDASQATAAGRGRILVEHQGVGGPLDEILPEDVRLIRRLTKIVDVGGVDTLRITLYSPGGATIAKVGQNAGALAAGDSFEFIYPKADELEEVAGGKGAVAVPFDAAGQAGTGASAMPLERASDMAEIDIKVDSIAVTAQTKKLKAKWSPELGQDLNAYHNLDAEVELTGILSEQIALEIDRELLGDLVKGATAGTRYWSRAPGLFVDSTGAEIGHQSAAPDFTGTVSEWYETLIETINDVSAQIHRKTLRGGANFVVCSPEVANILEFTSGFRASVTADQDRGTIGAVKAGSLSKKFDVYVDPYFLRNVLLVGRKGSSFLESGFVYAPYVPLQVTPTIFGTEDFVPRKGVMTRYAKKMVRPDMYGLVVVRGLLGEAGK